MMDGTVPNKNEYQGMYVICDHYSEEELERRAIQGRMVTTEMRGVLPEQSDSAAFRHVLDVGGGSGNWLITAQEMVCRLGN
ncbi:hypothetical protein KDH_10950 [Dictyobacter sp. S3.2.2.5]|uniref:O-methyltransferase domain-containing protein n=1 Tax=Dictyobacter halimunensis TaxID=3026934 RepID=A0ABQ6FPA1_9CHLR|nr:hypothetical protein KDH_10950 [Dictyobacter sp. S3.2.2.5]